MYHIFHMIDQLRNILDRVSQQDHKKHRLREVLQIIVLSLLSKQGFFQDHAFVWGTALRICHWLERFSEDLDFSVMHTGAVRSTETLLRELRLLWFEMERSPKTWVVTGGMLKFVWLSHILWFSWHPDQKVQIQCEIDTQAPAWASTETHVINDVRLFSLKAHTLPCLMAGKVHALLERGFVKGRDRYDLVWYLSKGVPIDLLYAQSALQQTGYKWPMWSWDEIAQTLVSKLWSLTHEQLLTDVWPFLQDISHRELLRPALIHSLLEKSLV